MREKANVSLNIAKIEYKRWLRSPKLIIVPVLLIVINNLVTQPLIDAAKETGYKISVFEPFIALTNSGFVLLLIPLCFMVLMADFPQKEAIDDLYHIRTEKRVWMLGQLLFAVVGAVSFVLFLLLSTIIMVAGNAEFKMDFSKGITNYSSIFPERYGGIVGELVPRNLYNQMTMGETLLLTMISLLAYLLIIILILLFFTIIGHKPIGVLINAILIAGGTICCAAKIDLQWCFPMSHTISWIHFSEYLRKMQYPIWKSQLYLYGSVTVLFVLCLVFARQYEPLGKE